ncbi:hypothetical protein R1sor_004402 [Riccia sorocarpa]|uniref:Small auxin up regulated protein n=1 Tax=Riccia sorocarpa TaxID=122646 RepID=A0ABD3HIL7_9MARC
MPRKVFSKSMVVHNFSHGQSRRGSDYCYPESPESPLSPRTLSSCCPSPADGEKENHKNNSNALRRVRKLAAGVLGKGIPPRGYIGVYVGKEKRRFIISTHYLNHRLFKELLKRSEEEYGFDYRGGLLIACETVLFEHLLWLIGSNDPAARTIELHDLMEFYELTILLTVGAATSSVNPIEQISMPSAKTSNCNFKLRLAEPSG